MDEPFPLLPFRTGLYSPGELFAGFDVTDPTSYGSTLDFRAYRSTGAEASREVGMLRALHDQCITEARDKLLAGRRVVAIMGGHQMVRGTPLYAQVAGMARDLTRRGFLLVSGGGPGAMEATHLGALVAGCDDAVLDGALDRLASAPNFPERAKELIAPDGSVDREVLVELHRWQRPAFEVLASIPAADRGRSLAVPTWFYGQEPPTPFASDLAKYFSNPLREDGLLAVASDGVIFAPGRAGTVQEVFQDACQNLYRTVGGRFSPMAFLDADRCWSERLPVEPLLRNLFGDADYDRFVATSADPTALVEFIASF